MSSNQIRSNVSKKESESISGYRYTVKYRLNALNIKTEIFYTYESYQNFMIGLELSGIDFISQSIVKKDIKVIPIVSDSN